uniref:Uncharacterized protein n=1 Tax=Tetranychus urticae TaxID=32264 RepID=T1KSL4_TETUR
MESMMNANDTRNGEFFESYSHIVKLITDVNNIMSFHNVDYLTVNSRDSFPQDELQEMIDAYIGDIEMVRKCEGSMGRADRVDMKIVERIKSLSNEVQNYYFYRDDNVFETKSIKQRTLDQCLWRFKLFLNQFTETFIRYLE